MTGRSAASDATPTNKHDGDAGERGVAMSADDRTRTHSPSFDRRVTVRMDTQLVEDLETAAGDDSLSDVLRDAARAYVRGGRNE